MKKPAYITTSIAYVNAEPHIGFLYELLAADVLTRYHKKLSQEVFFVTGTDEHGIKVAQAATNAGKDPQQYVDEVSGKFEALKAEFNLNWDYFIRTTNPAHGQFVQEKWQQLHEAGLLEEREYSGLYCKGCEAFKTESEAVNGKCVIHETPLEKVAEKNWFFTGVKKYKSQIKEWVNEAVVPETRRQEAINVLESGAYDAVSVSRPKATYGWGVEVPNDPDQIMYVWVDALFNYISALRINSKENLWPADYQIIGKDILKFHAIIWPALLLSCGYALPKKLLVHGFINVDGKKMSKSLGNVITPRQLLERYGVEASRYLLCKQLSFDEDSNFTWEDFDHVYHGDLANGLGNLLARLVGLARTLDLKTTNTPKTLPPSVELVTNAELERANTLIKETDQLITENKLWIDSGKKRQILEEAISNLLIIAETLEPFMPETVAEIRRQLAELDSKPMFPRLNTK